MTIGVPATPAILQFTFNNGQLAAGGSVLTQIGGVNAATYQDSALTTLLPNPIPLNSRGEVSDDNGITRQCFLTPNQVYTFTLFDAQGNQIWQAPYVNGVQLTAAAIDAISSAAPILASLERTTAEIVAGVTPTNYAFKAPHPKRYGAAGDGLADDHAALQISANMSGAGSGKVPLNDGYTYLCNADINVPTASTFGGPVASFEGNGLYPTVIFGTGSTFGFVQLGVGATTGGTTTSNYNYGATFRDVGVKLTGTANTAFFCNTINQPKMERCWIEGSGSNGRGAYFLNCLLPVFEDCLVTGCGSATQYSVEFDSCTTPQWRGSRISGGNTTKGGLAIDRCTNTVIDGCSSESCGIPIVISGKAEATLANTTITLKGLELENPGNGNPYIDIGAGLSGTALVVDVLLDGWFGSPSGTTTLPFAVRMQNIVGFEARGGHFTLAAGTSCFELVGTNVTGVSIRAHRNLKSLGVPWMRYNGSQVKSWGPEIDCGPLGLVQNGGGPPMCNHRGVCALFATGISLSGTSPSILSTSSMGGFYSIVQVSNGGATTMTLLDGEPGMPIGLYFANANTTLSTGAGLGQFNLKSGQANPPAAGSLLDFVNDGQNGGGGNRWTQV